MAETVRGCGHYGLKPLAFAVALSFCLASACFVTTCPASPYDLSDGNYDERRVEDFVRSLRDEHRYAEAVGYIRAQLAATTSDAARMSLMLLLADCQIDVGDYGGARATLSDAQILAADDSVKEKIAEREQRLSKLEIVLPPGLVGGAGADSLGVASGSTAIGSTAVTSESAIETAGAEPPPLAMVTNSFFETDLRQVLSDLSMQTGVPIIWDSTVQGLVTFEAVERPLDDVLRSILLPAGYSFSLQDGEYFVGSSNPQDPAFGLLSKTLVVTLTNIDAVEAIALLSDYFKPFVKASSKQGNVVCITAPPATLERIVEDLAALDAPPLQLLLEVVVTEIASGGLRKMGLDWRLRHSSDNASWEAKTDHTDIGGAGLSGTYMDEAVEIADDTVDLLASLQMLLETGDAKIRANPRITTINGRKAEIGLTKERYFIIATSVSQYYQYNTLQAISSGIRLEITPFASPSGSITVYVKPEVGDVVGSGAEGLPEITKRTASTSVRVKDGETFAVGGLNIQMEKVVKRGVPFLASIPLLGYLFRYDEREEEDSEIVIFVTPHIIKD